jgi:hypothetical protein
MVSKLAAAQYAKPGKGKRNAKANHRDRTREPVEGHAPPCPSGNGTGNGHEGACPSRLLTVTARIIAHPRPMALVPVTGSMPRRRHRALMSTKRKLV